MSTALQYAIALSLAKGIGTGFARQLLSYCGSPEAIFKEKAGKLRKIQGISSKRLAALQDPSLLSRAEKILQHGETKGYKTLFIQHDDYPFRLKQIADAPIVLYQQGNIDLENQRILSVVGTRKATAYGKDVLEAIVEGLKGYNPLIVSGLAYGIDAQAHRLALQNGLSTAAVMGTGLDLVYPAAHRNLSEQIKQQGALLSEYPHYKEADARQFPERNRIIAGLADATLVVEAAEKGGALITARLALEYDREVLAVPGGVNQEFSRGCNRIIQRNEAFLATSAEDIALQMNWSTSKKMAALPVAPDYDSFPEQEAIVLKCLYESKEQSLHIDTLSWQSSIPLAQLAGQLLNLEFKGIVKPLPGKKFKLK